MRGVLFAVRSIQERSANRGLAAIKGSATLWSLQLISSGQSDRGAAMEKTDKLLFWFSGYGSDLDFRGTPPRAIASREGREFGYLDGDF